MEVTKRNGKRETVSYDKITSRIKVLCFGLKVDPLKVAQRTIGYMYDGIKTSELDIISADQSEYLQTISPDYSLLAGRILSSNIQKLTPATFSEFIERAIKYVRFNMQQVEFVRQNAAALDAMIQHERDFTFKYTGIKTLQGLYLIEGDGYLERPQYMYMRSAICLGTTLDKIRNYYNLLSLHLYTVATPFLMNAMMENAQLMSCYLLGSDDNTEDLLKTDSALALISRRAGGCGTWYHNIRAKNQPIKSMNNGTSAGLLRFIKRNEQTALTFNQCGKRNGSFAFYLEPWHADVEDFLKLRLTTRRDADSARDIFLALWVPDLFVKRLITKSKWSLFSPDTAPYLWEYYDGMEVCSECGWRVGFNGDITTQPCDNHKFVRRDVFTEKYEEYEATGKAIEVVSTETVFDLMYDSFIDNGNPYYCFKDHVNRQTMQSNIGTIKSSNLCTEIMEYSDKNSIACCALSSISLADHVEDGAFNFAKLIETVRWIVKGLNHAIDTNNYPVPECKHNADNYRPIGIGVQGLADVFCMLRIPFLSPEAEKLDYKIFETIYYAAMLENVALAEEFGPYSAYEGSNYQRGLLKFDLWKQNRIRLEKPHTIPFSGDYDWSVVKGKPVRLSLLVAPMPTMTTAQVLGNNESFEPFSSNLFVKTSKSVKSVRLNPHLVKHLTELGVWSDDVYTQIKADNGSVMGLTCIDEPTKEIYRTIWEMKQSELTRRCAVRSAFIDQSSSYNVYTVNTNKSWFRSVFVGAWAQGMTTGCYYTRSRAATGAMSNDMTSSCTSGMCTS